MRWAVPILLLALGTPGAWAQDTPDPAAPSVASPSPASPSLASPRPAPAPRRPRPPSAAKPPPLEIAKLPPQLQAPRHSNAQAGVRAPVPDRNLDAPRVIPQDRASLGPSIINRNLPGRGQAADGAPNLLEDKLFRPAPGARLNVPFSF